MSKIGIIACGNSGIDYLDHDYDIRVIRSTLIFGDEEYEDFVDIKAEDFYNMLNEKPELHPTTAQAATGVILEHYEKMKEEGFTDIIFITISSGLSGTYEGAKIASTMISGVNVHVFDSLSVAYPQAYMTLRAAKMAKEGKKVTEIIDELVWLREHHGIYVSVDTLKYLVKNGRLSGAQGFVGSLLKIKPMLHLTRDGRIEPVEKIRTRKKAMQRMLDKFAAERKEKHLEVFIAHANAHDVLEEVRQGLLERRPELKEVKDYPLTPVVGAHAGPGTIAVGWIVKKK